jgi:hypothetical protein
MTVPEGMLVDIMDSSAVLSQSGRVENMVVPAYNYEILRCYKGSTFTVSDCGYVFIYEYGLVDK